jgi:hypothetical protein
MKNHLLDKLRELRKRASRPAEKMAKAQMPTSKLKKISIGLFYSVKGQLPN